MKTSYLKYYQLILEKVSFDRGLWEKEYRKAMEVLDDHEAAELRKWASKRRYQVIPERNGRHPAFEKHVHHGATLH